MLISMLSTGGKRSGREKREDTGVMGRARETPEDSCDSSPFSCRSIYILALVLSRPLTRFSPRALSQINDTVTRTLAG